MRLSVKLLVATAAVWAAMAATAPAAYITLPGIYNNSGGGGNYTNASSIPVSSTDLIEGLAPSGPNTDYVGTYEATGGTTAPLTDGQTTTDPLNLSQVTDSKNSLFDLNGIGWFVRYQLPGTTGYNLTSIVTTTGHQDFRVNQHFDILVSSDGTTFTSLSGGDGFAYEPSGGNGGAAQSTLTALQSTLTGQGGFLAANVRYVEFVALNGGNDVFRELDVNGSAVAATPEPASLTLLGFGAVSLLGYVGLRRRKRTQQS